MAPPNNLYSTQDVIVLVYFRSRGVQYRAIADLILQKGSKKLRDEGNLQAKVTNVAKKQRKEGGLAMYDDKTYTWNLEVTDQWLVDRIVSCAKERAIADGKNEMEAHLYYDKVKALTDVGQKEEKIIASCVSLE